MTYFGSPKHHKALLPPIAFLRCARRRRASRWPRAKDLGAGQPLNVVAGYIQMGPTPDSPAAGYFTVQGGPRDVELVAVTADLAQRVEMHESVKENGVATMKPLARAAVPAKGKLNSSPAASI